MVEAVAVEVEAVVAVAVAAVERWWRRWPTSSRHHGSAVVRCFRESVKATTVQRQRQCKYYYNAQATTN